MATHAAPYNFKYYKLARMVVRPDQQGRGSGSRALSRALAKADQEGLPVFLDTQLEINVRFYKKLSVDFHSMILYTRDR